MKYRDFAGVCGEEDANSPLEEYRKYHREVEASKTNFIRASVPDPHKGGLRTRDTKLWVPSPDGEHPLRHLISSEAMAGVPWTIHARYYQPQYQKVTRRLSSRSRPFVQFALHRQANYARDLRKEETLPIQVFCTDCPMDPDLKYPNGHWLSGYNRAEGIMDGRGYIFTAGMVLEFRGLTVMQHNMIDYELNTEHGFPLAPMDSFLMARNYMDGGMSLDEVYEQFANPGESRAMFDDGLLGAFLFRAHDKDVDFLNRIDKNGGHTGRTRTPQELGRGVKVFGRAAIGVFLDHGKDESKRRWMLFLNDKTGISGALGGGNGFMGDRLEGILGYNANVKMREHRNSEGKWSCFESMIQDYESVESMRTQLDKNRRQLKDSKVTADEELSEAILACSKYINMVGTMQLRKVRAGQSKDEKESLVRSALILGDVYRDLMNEEEPTG